MASSDATSTADMDHHHGELFGDLAPWCEEQLDEWAAGIAALLGAEEEPSDSLEDMSEQRQKDHARLVTPSPALQPPLARTMPTPVPDEKRKMSPSKEATTSSRPQVPAVPAITAQPLALQPIARKSPPLRATPEARSRPPTLVRAAPLALEFFLASREARYGLAHLSAQMYCARGSIRCHAQRSTQRTRWSRHRRPMAHAARRRTSTARPRSRRRCSSAVRRPRR